jgi:DNA polymerase-1
LGDHLTSTLGELTQKIYHCANSEFNINSPAQLGVILFEHLGLKGSKKTKTGYSTDEKVLSSLENDHPIIPLLLEYRELFKLKSTYIDPLLALALSREDHKIFTSFLQTGTATGRLSSRNPNLQNIPVRGNWGQEVRNGFIASQGNTFIGIDYSQIELRLLAHFSKDPTLIEAFQAGADIHYETAVKLFGEDEAKNKRHIAKTVNFGILYGMGSRKLSEDLGIPPKEAKEIIENYFSSFPTIKEYIATVHQNVQNDGFVETLLGRRRYFDFAKANGMQQAMYLRESVNTIFQGSASDLIKLAMNKIHETIHTQNLPLNIVLQIHDELILETPLEKAQQMSTIVQEIMENVIHLDVPLTTSIAIANRWGELK